jgi:hypothetical protein
VNCARHGPDGGVPAGFAVIPAGTVLLRGHTPGKTAAWFGPSVGAVGVNRFDLPQRDEASAPGVCYLAPRMEGVLVERVVRDVRQPVLSLRTLAARHAISRVTLRRDIVLVDLLLTPWTCYGVQVSTITAPPPYTATQTLAASLVTLGPVRHTGHDAARPPDGILYGSRFGGAIECVALWDRAAEVLDWSRPQSIVDDEPVLAAAATQLGVGLID